MKLICVQFQVVIDDLYRVVAREMQRDILQEASMAGTEHESVTVEPFGVLGIILHSVPPQDITHFRHSQR